MKHDLIRIQDPNGREVVGVKLSNTAERAWLDANDFDRVTAEVGPVSWFAGFNDRGQAYVRLKNPHTGRPEPVARILTGRVMGGNVGYADGDRFNLRQANLYVTHGNGGRPKKRRIARVTDRRPSNLGQGIAARL